MIKETANKLINLGYEIVVEDEKGISLVKEDIKMCVIIVEDFEDDLVYGNSILRKPLEDKYPFANKGTMCIFKNPPKDMTINELERDPYYAVKVWFMHMDCVPHKRNEDIVVEILPLEDIEDYDSALSKKIRGECEMLDPFSDLDGITTQIIYRYLAKLKGNGKIYYPRCIASMQLSWLRYVTSKFYTEETTK